MSDVRQLYEWCRCLHEWYWVALSLILDRRNHYHIVADIIFDDTSFTRRHRQDSVRGLVLLLLFLEFNPCNPDQPINYSIHIKSDGYNRPQLHARQGRMLHNLNELLASSNVSDQQVSLLTLGIHVFG